MQDPNMCHPRTRSSCFPEPITSTKLNKARAHSGVTSQSPVLFQPAQLALSQAMPHHSLGTASVRCYSLPRKQNEHAYSALKKKRV